MIHDADIKSKKSFQHVIKSDKMKLPVHHLQDFYGRVKKVGAQNKEFRLKTEKIKHLNPGEGGGCHVGISMIFLYFF